MCYFFVYAFTFISLQTFMWDPSKGKGFLYFKFKNNNRSDKRTNVPEVIQQNEPELSQEEKDELTLFFKTCVVPDQKLALLRKLEATVQFRTTMLKDATTNFTELFPFYFVCPDIVS